MFIGGYFIDLPSLSAIQDKKRLLWCKIQNFNEFVKSRSREPSPLRDASPARRPRAETGMEEAYQIPIPLENIGCQDLLQLPCSHCGWLRKRRNLKTLNTILSWPQAYVVLHEGCFYYFNNERAKGSAGRFSLYGYNSVFRASDILPKEATWSFKIVHSHREFKTYYFSASSEKEMKDWMSLIKKEMLHANGKSAIYGRGLTKDKDQKETKEEPSDDAKFYQDVEQNIYDDHDKFVPTQDYTKKCSIKRECEDSDDDDLIVNPKIDKRPPCPLPTDQTKIMSEPPLRPPVKPPRTLPDEPEPTRPQTPPRTHRQIAKTDANPQIAGKSTTMMQALQISQEILERNNERKEEDKKVPKRRGSYEKTDAPGQGEIKPTKYDYKTGLSTGSGGGSTGEDDPEHVDTEEYWASIYFDEDKYKAHDTIEGIAENGVYLVRQENAGSGKVLVVYACDQTKKYRIQQNLEGQYYLAKEGYKNASLEELLYYYYENDLPTISQKLIRPYRLHPNFKELKI